jgi:hypothetical protein
MSAIFTRPELERLIARGVAPEFREAVNRLRREVAGFLALELAPPEFPGGYYHDYICPEHGVQLLFRADSPTRHTCPVDGALFEGARFDAAWRWFVNHEISEAALRMAVLHRLGEPLLLEPLRRIFLGYADRYAFYARQPRTGTTNPGAATYTTLDESVWSVPLAWAYSLIESDLSPIDQEQIKSMLFVPTAEHLVKRHYRKLHNFSCWHNAAIATLGRVVDRPDLVAGAIDTASGQRTQLREGMLPDGLWWEGSMSYHFYALWAVLVSAIAARHDPHLDIFAEPAIRQALRTVIDCAYPDGTLPATHDCWYFTSVTGEACHGVPPAPDFYEIALSAYDEPAFAAVLTKAYAQSPRDSVYALLFGPDHIVPHRWPARGSFVIEPSGLAFLRPPGSGLDLMMKFGPTGEGHGHPDKLAITGYADGWRFSPDLGTPGYGVASLETWYRQTLSHNTVLIDGLSQPPACGALVGMQTDQLPHSMEAQVSWTEGEYAGVFMRRRVMAHPEYFVDVFTVQCEQPRRIEWIYHNAGEAMLLDGSEQYQHLASVQALRRFLPVRLAWKDTAGSLSIWLAPSAEEDLFTGTSPGHPPSERMGFVLRQRHAKEAVFVAVLHPYREKPRVRNVVWQADGRFAVELEHRRDQWDLFAAQ